jgi:uncharacterized OsmC-like protein
MALTTMKVSTNLKQGFKTNIQASTHEYIIDQPKAAGGEDLGPNPLEVFLSSLGACICTLGRIISIQRRLDIEEINCDVEGDLDKDFLMGKTTEGRAGFTNIRSFVTITADLTHEQKQALISEIAKRCPVADNLLNVTIVSSQLVS